MKESSQNPLDAIARYQPKKDFSDVCEILEKAVELWPNFYKENKATIGDNNGLYLAVLGKPPQFNTTGIIIGNLEDNKRLEKMNDAWEKVGRIATGDPFVLTSFATQNYAENKYGGGIRSSSVIVAASGLSPATEHQFVLTLLVNTNNCGHIEFKSIQREFDQFEHLGK